MSTDAFTISAGGYTAKPFVLTTIPETAWKLQVLLKFAVEHNAFFSDFQEPAKRAEDVLRDLAKPGTVVWEVVKDVPSKGHLAFVGILRLTDVRPGEDALAHYFFFDRDLRSKTPLLRAWMEWGFANHAGWQALHRATVEVPGYMHALAAHAKKHLGFSDEGRRREAHMYNGKRYDTLLLGKLKEQHDAIRQ